MIENIFIGARTQMKTWMQGKINDDAFHKFVGSEDRLFVIDDAKESDESKQERPVRSNSEKLQKTYIRSNFEKLQKAYPDRIIVESDISVLTEKIKNIIEENTFQPNIFVLGKRMPKRYLKTLRTVCDPKERNRLQAKTESEPSKPDEKDIRTAASTGGLDALDSRAESKPQDSIQVQSPAGDAEKSVNNVTSYFEEIFKDPDGVPKYKIFHGYDGEGQPFQYVEIYGKDGKTPVIHSNEHNMSFEVKVPKGQKQDDIMYNRATYDIEKDEIKITHTGSMGLFEDFDVTSKGNIITIKDRHFHGGVNSPDVKVGTYNIETGEINCDQFFEKDLDYAPKFSEQIKGIIERLYGSEKPVPVKQLYEQKMSIVNDLLNNKELKPERVEIPWEL
jgi:hypothetical protein